MIRDLLSPNASFLPARAAHRPRDGHRPARSATAVDRCGARGDASGGDADSASPEEELGVEVAVEERLDRNWNVIVWNDPVNLMTYVTYVIQRLFGYSLEKATKLMLEVHNLGKSVVATVPREKAEYFVGRLHGFGLQATLEQS
ncbi:MAG: ATP-dependent Clp protease adapter ClpS [Planctomycetes bacterium]|nr:ATP-dependent Clp protease adapter ClpS [Planctomycetota bacterium]